MPARALFREIRERLADVPDREQLHHLAGLIADLDEVQQDWLAEPEQGTALAEVCDQIDVHPGTAQLLLWAAVSLAALADQQAHIRDALEHGDSAEIRNLLAHLAYGIELGQKRGSGGRLKPFDKPPGISDRRAPWAKLRLDARKRREKAIYDELRKGGPDEGGHQGDPEGAAPARDDDPSPDRDPSPRGD